MSIVVNWIFFPLVREKLMSKKKCGITSSLLIFLTGAVVLSGCSVIGIRSGTEQASYEVMDRLSETVEVRRYPPLIVAETFVNGSKEGTDRSEAFRRLFDYISGSNRGRAKVAMTVPVETISSPQKIAMTAPVETSTAMRGRFSMRFILPAQYTMDTAPTPANDTIRVYEIPERFLAVLRYTGSTGTEKSAEKRDVLERAIERSKWRVDGDASAMFYDPPWTLPFLRRNEVAFPVSRD